MSQQDLLAVSGRLGCGAFGRARGVRQARAGGRKQVAELPSELIWGSDAVKSAWLQVTVRGNDELGDWNTNTGLGETDVFYFGSAPGDSGEGDLNCFTTNSTDEMAARNNPRSLWNRAAIDDPYDFNRDGLVNATDQMIVRNFSTSINTALKFLDFSSGGRTSELTVASSEDPRSSSPTALSSTNTNLATAIVITQSSVLASPPLGPAADNPLAQDPATLRADTVDAHFLSENEAISASLPLPPRADEDAWSLLPADEDVIDVLADSLSAGRRAIAV